MDIQQLQNQINAMQAQIDELRSNSTIPLDIGEAFKARVLPDGILSALPSGLPPSTTSIFVPPASNYTVPSVMTGFITATINGVTYNIPYY